MASGDGGGLVAAFSAREKGRRKASKESGSDSESGNRTFVAMHQHQAPLPGPRPCRVWSLTEMRRLSSIMEIRC